MVPGRPRRLRRRLGVAQRYERMAPGTPCRQPVPRGAGPSERRPAIGLGIVEGAFQGGWCVEDQCDSAVLSMRSLEDAGSSDASTNI